MSRPKRQVPLSGKNVPSINKTKSVSALFFKKVNAVMKCLRLGTSLVNCPAVAAAWASIVAEPVLLLPVKSNPHFGQNFSVPSNFKPQLGQNFADVILSIPL